jgi:glycopeptide antibiotics resistance protein
MMIFESGTLLLVVPIWLAARLLAFRSGRASGKFSLKREVVLNIFFIYMLCLIGVTLFPFEISFDRNHIWISANVIPVMGTVKEITKTLSDPNMPSYMIKFWIINIAGNLILLLPLGAIVPILWSKFDNAFKTVFFAFCVSLNIEVMQLLSCFVGNTRRAFDVDDILLNTIGAYAGYIICKKIIEGSKHMKDKHLQKDKVAI